jgi:hypothetical protein
VIIVDGNTYQIPVVSLKRTADVLDKSAFRTEDGTLHRELIGVYYNYQLKFGRTLNVSEYAEFWNKITEPVPFHTVTVPDEDGSYTFTAYIANVSDEIVYTDSAQSFWKNLTVNFIAKSPART